MKIGILAPQFLSSPEPALKVADEAEQKGIDGVFVFDHLWSLDQPEWSPSQSAMPLVSALVSRTKSLTVGTLVARVGIESNDLLFSQLMTVAGIAGGRFVAAIGMGDKLSKRENAAYGVEFPPREARLELLDDLVARLSSNGVTVWVGGRSPEIRRIAERNRVAVNQWQARVDELQPTDTWGGVFSDAGEVRALTQHGVAWSVFLVPGAGRNPKGAVQTLSDAVKQ